MCEESLIPVHTYTTHPEASLARALLDYHNIDSWIQSDDCGGLAGGQTFVRGIKLMVNAADAEKARTILNTG